MKVRCPHCGSEFESAADGAPEELACPECGGSLGSLAEAETVNATAEDLGQPSRPTPSEAPTDTSDAGDDTTAPTVAAETGTPASESPTAQTPQVRVNCFDCGREFVIPLGQTDATCPRCGAPFSMLKPRSREGTGAGSLDAVDTIVTARKPGDKPKPPETEDESVSWMREHFRGKYEILDFVSRGGMGAVYRARQRRPVRDVALKVMLGGAFASATNKKRFAREAQAVAQLKHPAVVPVYEFGEAAGQPYFTMEFVEGTDLRTYCRTRQLSREEICRMMVRVCDAIQYAHEHGVIHRDLKPGNILVDELGRPRILDFGLSRATTPDGEDVSLLTATGDFMGTPRYISPEQAWGSPKEVDERTDVYSLGAVLYELIVGLLPYPIENVKGLQALDRLRTAKPLSPSALHPDMPRDLEVILLKAVAKDKRERYDSAEALARDLENFLADRPITARPPTWGYVVEKWVLRNRRTVLPLAALLVLAATVGTVFLVHYVSLRRYAGTMEETIDEARLQAILSDPERGLREFIDEGDWRGAYDYARFGPRLLPLAERGSVDYLVDKVRYRARTYVDRRLKRLEAMLGSGDYEAAAGLATELSSVAQDMPYEDLADRLAAPAEDLAAFAWPIVKARAEEDWSRTRLAADVQAYIDAFPSTPQAEQAATFLAEQSTMPDEEMLARLQAAFEKACDRRDWVAAEDVLASARQLPEADGQAGGVWPAAIADLGGRLRDIIRLPTVAELRQLRTLETPGLPGGGFPYTKCLAFSPDGAVLASGAHNGGLTLWDAASGEPIRTLTMRDELRSLCFTPDGSLLAAGMGDGQLALVQMPEGRTAAEWQTERAGTGRIECLSFSPDGAWLLAADKDGMDLWDVQATLEAGEGRRHDLARIGGSRPALISSDGQLIAAYSGAEQVRVWHADPPFPLSVLPGLGRPDSLAFSPDSRSVAASYDNGAVRTWQVDVEGSARKFVPSQRATLDMAFSPDGRLLATVGRDETLRLWEAATGSALAVREEAGAWLFAVRFSPDARWLAIGGNEATIRLYGVRPTGHGE